MSRIASIALFCAIAVLAVDPPLVLLAFEDRAAREATLARRADPSPELAAFLTSVRARTKKGESVVLLLPARDWERYSRGYFRASYLLAGRTVLPVLTKEGTVARENLARADYIAAWRVRYAGDGSLVWQGHGGTLVRRR